MHEALAKAKFDEDVSVLTPVYCTRKGWALDQCAFPILDVTIQAKTPVRLRFTCDNWDELPPSITILTPEGIDWKAPLPGGVFNGGAHEVTGKPFICMRGSREFHTHGGHKTETWDNYRAKEANLVNLLTQLTDVWRDAMGRQ